MFCFVYVSRHNTKEWEPVENLLVLIKTCAIRVIKSQETINYCCSEIIHLKLHM